MKELVMCNKCGIDYPRNFMSEDNLCRKCRYKELTYMQCMSIFLKSDLHLGKNVILFCENPQNIFDSFVNFFAHFRIPCIIHDSCITLESGEIFVFTYINPVDSESCIALSKYTNWIVFNDSIILASDTSIISDEYAKLLLTKCQRTNEFVCHHQYLKDEYAKITKAIHDVLLENPKAVEQYINGNTKVVNFLIGMLHKKTDSKYESNVFIPKLTSRLEMLKDAFTAG